MSESPRGPETPEDGTSPDDDQISCEEAFERVYEFLDGELCTGWTERVRRHLEICRRCYPAFNFERVFLDHVRGLGLEPHATEQLEAKVRKALSEE